MADINTANVLTPSQIQTAAGGPGTLANKTFYVKPKLSMFRLGVEDFLLMKDAVKKAIPDGNNGSATFVRYAPTVTNLTSLGDFGDNPNANVKAVEIQVTTDNYGQYRAFNDQQFKLTYDTPEVYRQELPLVHMETLEEVLRNNLIVNSDKVIAGGQPNIASLTATDIADIAEINAAALSLRSKLLPGFKERKNRYKVLATIGQRDDLGLDSLVEKQQEYNRNAYNFDNTNAQDIEILNICVMEYKKAHVVPSYTDANTYNDIAGRAANANVTVHDALIYGAEAFGIAHERSLGEIIIKKANSQYINDPLNRIQETQGFKVSGYGTTILSKVITYSSAATDGELYFFNTDATILDYKAQAVGDTFTNPGVGDVIQG